MDVELKVKLANEASAALKKVETDAINTAQKIGTASDKVAAQTAAFAEKSAARNTSAFQKNAQARQMLGMRSEHAIQREITRTEAAYNRLKNTGTLSFNEQARAAEQMRQKIAGLTREMKGYNQAQKEITTPKTGGFNTGTAMGVGMGAYAAYRTIAPKFVESMQYDERLANMANTAYNDRDVAGRIKGKGDLEGAITRARIVGGGTRESAAEALDLMLASGAVSVDDGMQMLPDIMKAAKAGKTDPKDIAMIAIRAQQSFKIKPEDMSAIFSSALVAGQEGGFELNNMAKWLPEQMAMARNLGMSGKDDFLKLLSWNQASVITSGSPDQAGNNMRDLLNELNTPHFKRFLGEQLHGGKRAKAGERVTRQKEIDDIFLEYQQSGVGKVDATLDIMNKLFAKDQKYVAMQAKLRTLDKDDNAGKQEIYSAMAAQMEGSAIGKVFHNQQSLMAFLGLINNADYVDKIAQRAGGELNKSPEQLETETSSAVIRSTTGDKMERAQEDKKTAEKLMLDELSPAISKAASAFSDLAQKHPALTGAVTLATPAMVAFAGSVGFATLMLNKGGAAGLGGGLGGGAIARTATVLGKGVGVGLVAEVAATAGDQVLGKAFGEESAVTRYGSSAMHSAAIGAAIGSIIPGIGTAIGAAIGATGGILIEGYKDYFNKNKGDNKQEVDVKTNMTVGLAPGLVLQKQETKASSNAPLRVNVGNAWVDVPA